MLALSLVLILTSGLVADLSPEELIERLGSPDRVVREEAARTLEEQSVEVLPALRVASDAAKVPEARERFADLISRIEARALDRPSMIRLDLEDRPLNEAVEALAIRSGFPITLDDPALASRPVTVRTSGPLPFWEAVDRLGRAGHVRHDPGARPDKVGNEPRVSTIRLVAGDPPAAFTAYSGPLRVHLFATHRHRDLNFQAFGAPRGPQNNAMVTVEVQAFAEPGRFINPNGLPRLEAVDEQGRAISPEPGAGVEPSDPSEHSWLVPGRLSLLHWHVPLGLPVLPARSPLRLRGVLPVVISSRRPDPLIISLVDTAGKAFRKGQSVVRIEKVATDGEQTTTVNLLIGEERIPTDRTQVAAGPQTDFIGDYLRNRVEFLDAKGHALSWLLLGNRPTPTTSGEFQVKALVSGVEPPDRLHVYQLHRLATEVPFEFSGVPSP